MNKRQLSEAVRIAMMMALLGKIEQKPDEIHQCPTCGREYKNHGPKYCPECKKRLWEK